MRVVASISALAAGVALLFAIVMTEGTLAEDVFQGFLAFMAITAGVVGFKEAIKHRGGENEERRGD